MSFNNNNNNNQIKLFKFLIVKKFNLHYYTHLQKYLNFKEKKSIKKLMNFALGIYY